MQAVALNEQHSKLKRRQVMQTLGGKKSTQASTRQKYNKRENTSRNKPEKPSKFISPQQATGYSMVMNKTS
jgi:hypothetical protein